MDKLNPIFYQKLSYTLKIPEFLYPNKKKNNKYTHNLKTNKFFAPLKMLNTNILRCLKEIIETFFWYLY